MKIKGISDIFFDLDHTLWDFDKNSALTFVKIFEINQVDIDIRDFLNVYEPINLDYWKLYREDRIDKESLRYRRLRDSFDAINKSISDSLINKLADDYIDNLATYNHLFDGTIELLNYLNSKYKLHIITNGFHEVQHRKLEKSKIATYFETVTNSEMVGVKKPHFKIFEFALNSANAKAESSIMIGDNLEADILGAINFGIDAICFNIHDVQVDKNIKQVKKLLELKAYL